MNVILLKSNDSTTSDRYVDYLHAQHSSLLKHVEQINLLKFSYQNLNQLKSKLFSFFLHSNYEQYLNECFKCLIITSRQTVEAIHQVLELGPDSAPIVHPQPANICTEMQNFQDKLIVYCVGEATGSRFKQLVHSLREINPTVDSRLIIRCASDINKTEHNQNARQLFKLVKQDYELIEASLKPTSDNFKYALYPCSKIRKDDLSKNLSENRISFDEIHVYDTVPSEIGKQKLKNTLDQLDGQIILVFFSPSGCESVFKDTTLNNYIKSKLNTFSFVSIGPSTSSKLRDYIEPNLIYELAEPSPHALWDLIVRNNSNLNKLVN